MEGTVQGDIARIRAMTSGGEPVRSGAADGTGSGHVSAVPDVLLPRIGRVHHVAIVVRDIDAALPFWRDTLGLTFETVMPMPQDRVSIAFLGVGESKIELVAPSDDTTGVARFLASRGEGFHHVCFEVADIAAALGELAEAGIQLIDTAPRQGAEGPVAFLHPSSCQGVLVELIEAPGGPAWVVDDTGSSAKAIAKPDGPA